MSLPLKLLAALMITELVECSVYVVWCRSVRKLWAVLLCNLFTNPLVNLLLLFIPSLTGSDSVRWVSVGSLELSVVLTEALLLGSLLKLGRGKALVLSLLLNTASYLAGVFLQAAGVL